MGWIELTFLDTQARRTRPFESGTNRYEPQYRIHFLSRSWKREQNTRSKSIKILHAFTWSAIRRSWWMKPRYMLWLNKRKAPCISSWYGTKWYWNRFLYSSFPRRIFFAKKIRRGKLEYKKRFLHLTFPRTEWNSDTRNSTQRGRHCPPLLLSTMSFMQHPNPKNPLYSIAPQKNNLPPNPFC